MTQIPACLTMRQDWSPAKPGTTRKKRRSKLRIGSLAYLCPLAPSVWVHHTCLRHMLDSWSAPCRRLRVGTARYCGSNVMPRGAWSQATPGRRIVRGAMPGEYRLVVHCKNPASSYSIALPYSIPAGKNVDPRETPMELFPLRVLCRECVLWYVYSAEDAEWGGFPTRHRPEDKTSPTSWILEAKCAVQGCGSLTRWHVGDDSGLSGHRHPSANMATDS
jgi:hypothetical protein